ncbi:sensor histidine kinase [Ruminiclostridium cellobioparum]|uniref:sensor histidine kinase n=1 Tax=Ruminiclostridium cellobioparum TaxID=29355 RepID=UPI0028AF4B1F|nr:histidine kinase [Ruminiclostridium cellobioparum]
MIELVDKAVIFIACVVLYIIDTGDAASVIPVIVSLTLSALNSYFDKKQFRIIAFSGYILLCQFAPEFLVFVPVLFYDIFAAREQLLALAAFIPFITHNYIHSHTLFPAVVVLSAFSYLLKFRTFNFKNIRKQYMILRDTSKERSILLEKKNNELMEKQDYEINMATLNERNRIAMEIHDNVGHLLSRCLLQLGALMAVNKEDNLKENLSSIKNTLSQAMDSIRSSVHNLHDESIDLRTHITGLVDNFKFCPISLDYDITGTVDKRLKYCLIAIVKEALSNIIKHSNATEATVTLREHPALYQLIIQDNGSVTGYNLENGIGLSNISERVKAFNANIDINTDNGFKIFISIPKWN